MDLCINMLQKDFTYYSIHPVAPHHYFCFMLSAIALSLSSTLQQQEVRHQFCLELQTNQRQHITRVSANHC